MRSTELDCATYELNDLSGKEAIGSNYFLFVVTLLLASTTSLAEAGTATHFPLSESSVGRVCKRRPSNHVRVTSFVVI